VALAAEYRRNLEDCTPYVDAGRLIQHSLLLAHLLRGIAEPVFCRRSAHLTLRSFQ
jgi:hypothetical protein